MKDFRPSELQAEYYVQSVLLKAGILNCKPNFDQHGADLLIVDSLESKIPHILNVQCKYRKIAANKSSNIEIPIEYVSDHFLVFAYVVDDQNNDQLFVFFPEDVKSWNKDERVYRLTLTQNKLPDFANKLFNEQNVQRIRMLLSKQPVKKFTTLVIDGVFLEKVIPEVIELYRDIYPDLGVRDMSLDDVVTQILKCYNRYDKANVPINIALFSSKHHNLAGLMQYGHDAYYKSEHVPGATFYIFETGEIISFEVVEYLERVINSDNVILVANDISYETPLIALREKGIDITLVTLQEELGGQIFSGTTWGDIVYPLAMALGVPRQDL